MQLNATFAKDQSETSAGNVANVTGTVKRFEQMRQICFRDTDATVTNGKYRRAPVAACTEYHMGSLCRIFHAVAKKICKDVPQQDFIRLSP